MGMNKPDIHEPLVLRRTSGVFDHFNSYTDTQMWTKGGIVGTVTNPDANGGKVVLTTGAVVSQTAFVASTRKNWQFATGKPMIFQIGLDYTEANVNQAGIFVGFTSAFVGILTALTGVPLNPVSACGVFKKPGDTLWSCFTSIGAVQLITQTKASTIQPGICQEIIVNVMIQGANLEATFSIGGAGPQSVVGGGGSGLGGAMPNVTTMAAMQPVKHVLPIAGAAAMFIGASVLSGSASSEVVNVDYIGAEMLSIP